MLFQDHKIMAISHKYMYEWFGCIIKERRCRFCLPLKYRRYYLRTDQADLLSDLIRQLYKSRICHFQVTGVYGINQVVTGLPPVLLDLEDSALERGSVTITFTKAKLERTDLTFRKGKWIPDRCLCIRSICFYSVICLITGLNAIYIYKI